MRPPGEVAQALLRAARQLAGADHKPTQVALADYANVGRTAARYAVANMRRAGVLDIVGERRVEYRNRPVAEYAPARADAPAAHAGLSSVFMTWAR